jgi:glutamine amidotransferase PdxT
MEFVDDFRNSGRAASQYRLLLPNKKPQPRLGLIEVCVLRSGGGKDRSCVRNPAQIGSEDQNLKVVFSRPPAVSEAPLFSM